MLKLDEKLVTVLIALGIAASYGFLVVSVAFLLIPAPYSDDYYPLFETKEECEQAGAVWLEEELGGYCDTYDILDEYYQEYDTALNIYLALVVALVIITGLATILVSLFLIKNKTIAYGFFGGGLSLAAGSVLLLSSYHPMTFIIAVAISLAVLVFIGLRRGSKTR